MNGDLGAMEKMFVDPEIECWQMNTIYVCLYSETDMFSTLPKAAIDLQTQSDAAGAAWNEIWLSLKTCK